MPTALVTIRTPAGESYDFRVGRPTIVIGRRIDCDLALPTPEVSSRHAELRIVGSAGSQASDQLIVTDLGSKNGTFVAGQRLEPGVPRPLDPDTEVEIANVVLTARLLAPGEDDSQSLSLDTSSSLSRSLLRGLLGEAVRRSRARIEVTRGPAKGQVLPIMESAEHIRLGAGPQVELDLEEPKLASNPLLLVLGGHGYHVVAPPGIPVRVGDRRVVDPVRLRSGDVISLLKTRLAFVDPLQPAIDDLAELAQADDTETRPAVSVSSSGGAGEANAPNPRHVETIRQPMVKAGRFKAGERLILVIAILSLFAALGFLAVVLEIIEL